MSLKKVFTIVNVCSLLFTLLQIFTKDLLINRGVTVFEFVFFRSVFNMISSAMLVKLTFKEQFNNVPRNLCSTMILRCFTATLMFISFATAPMFIPLGIFQTVQNTQTFITAFLSFMMLNEKISVFEIFAMVFAFGGVVMIGVSRVKEDPILGELDVFGLSEAGLFRLGLIFAISTAFFWSLSTVLTRKLKQINIGILQFYYACLSSLVSAIPLIYFYFQQNKLPFVYDNIYVYLELLGGALTNFLG